MRSLVIPCRCWQILLFDTLPEVAGQLVTGLDDATTVEFDVTASGEEL